MHFEDQRGDDSIDEPVAEKFEGLVVWAWMRICRVLTMREGLDELGLKITTAGRDGEVEQRCRRGVVCGVGRGTTGWLRPSHRNRPVHQACRIML